MMDPTDRQAASRGFTVVELLVALGLAAVVFGLIVSFFANMSRSTTTQNAAAAAQQTARAGVDFMAQELRLAGLDPLNSAGAGIEEISAAGTKIRFTSDSCNVQIGDSGTCENPVPDGNVNGKNERVTYLYRCRQSGYCAAACMRALPPSGRKPPWIIMLCWSRSSRTPATSRFSRFGTETTHRQQSSAISGPSSSP